MRKHHQMILTLINLVCQAIKDNSRPFSGIQCIVVSDFYQLPHMKCKHDDGKLLVLAPLWPKTISITMNDNENTLFDHNIQIEITIYKQFR